MGWHIVAAAGKSRKSRRQRQRTNTEPTPLAWADSMTNDLGMPCSKQTWPQARLHRRVSMPHANAQDCCRERRVRHPIPEQPRPCSGCARLACKGRIRVARMPKAVKVKEHQKWVDLPTEPTKPILGRKVRRNNPAGRPDQNLCDQGTHMTV